MGSRERPQPSAVPLQPGTSRQHGLLSAPPPCPPAPPRPSLHTVGTRPFICAGPGYVTQSCDAVIVPTWAGGETVPAPRGLQTSEMHQQGTHRQTSAADTFRVSCRR